MSVIEPHVPGESGAEVVSGSAISFDWKRCRELLRKDVGEDVYASWFAAMNLEDVRKDAVYLSVPTRFLKSWIQSHYAEKVLAACQEVTPRIHRIELSIRSPKAYAPREKAPETSSPGPPKPTQGETPKKMSGQTAIDGPMLNPKYTFDTFCVGHSNVMAHAAAKRTAETKREGSMCTPLYIHSNVGLGKTHLLQAIAGCAAEWGRSVLYLTADKLANDALTALRSNNLFNFQEALRVDLLIIDDLQFLHGAVGRARFGQILNAAIDAGRTLVAAADRPPMELEIFDERVRSRLAGGLVVGIGALGEKLRLDILTGYLSAVREASPDFAVPPLVAAYIAKTLVGSGRDLEGAVNRLVAHFLYTGKPVDMEMAECQTRDFIRPAELVRIKVEGIQHLVANHHNVSRADLLSDRRTANVVRPRQVGMYLAKVLTPRSLSDIGQRFGGRDHSTVFHAVRKIENLVETDPEFAQEIELLKRQLSGE